MDNSFSRIDMLLTVVVLHFPIYGLVDVVIVEPISLRQKLLALNIYCIRELLGYTVSPCKTGIVSKAGQGFIICYRSGILNLVGR
ncbi:hypothetical protein D3C74_331930 [compost metagenome]